MLTGQNFSILYVNISLYNIQIYKYIYIYWAWMGFFRKTAEKCLKRAKYLKIRAKMYKI